MFDYSAAHFDEMCRTGRVASQLATIEESRQAAVRGFWMYLLGGLALSVAVGWSLVASGWPVFGMLLAFGTFVTAIVLAIRPLTHASRGLKHPVLETIAGQGGMEYLPDGFEPPVFPSARPILFGGLSSAVFTDLFHGKDEAGRLFAAYEANLTRRQGKNTVTVFTGQIYAFQRRSRSGGETAILPDKGLFNFIKPKGTERVKFDSDPDFEKKFEVYATHPASALGLVGADVRRTLLELRHSGNVWAYVGPEDVLVAVWGKNRFEPGSMFRARPGRERAQRMFDDVCAVMATLAKLNRALG